MGSGTRYNARCAQQGLPFSPNEHRREPLVSGSFAESSSTEAINLHEAFPFTLDATPTDKFLVRLPKVYYFEPMTGVEENLFASQRAIAVR